MRATRICVSDIILLSALLLRMQPDGDGGAAAAPRILGDLGRAALGRLRGDKPGESWTLDFAAKVGLQACPPDTRRGLWWATDRSGDCVLLVPSQRLWAVARFLALAVGLGAWCHNVGHPDVFVREAEAEERRKEASSTDDDPEDAGRARAERVLADGPATFAERYEAVRTFIDEMAKPVGALGTLEAWAARLGALRRTTRPKVGDVMHIVFAADHGAAKARSEGGEACSAYPQAVTTAVFRGIAGGGCGCNVLGEANGVLQTQILDVGCAGALAVGGGRAAFKLEGGTRNFCVEPAMTESEARALIAAGRQAAAASVAAGAGALVLGEIGIGNTTCAACLVAAFTGTAPEEVVDAGARIGRAPDPAKRAQKVDVVARALARAGVVDAAAARADPVAVLAELGGAEVCALVGSFLEAGERGVPVLVDGFIASAAALAAALAEPACTNSFFLATKSAATGHAAAVAALQQVAGHPPLPGPALDMGLRLGEGTGAVLAVPLLRSAAALLDGMEPLAALLGS